MLLYPLQEAVDLLETKLSGAQKSLEETIEDLEWLREQVTVMEVNFARVHNVSGRASIGIVGRGMLMIVGCQAVCGVWIQYFRAGWAHTNDRRRGQKEAGSGMVASGRQDKDDEEEEEDD